jgi:hypothetical protein
VYCGQVVDWAKIAGSVKKNDTVSKVVFATRREDQSKKFII